MGQDPPARLLLRAPTTTDLRPSSNNKRPPFGLPQELDSVRASTADGFRMSFHNRRAPAAGFLQWLIASGVCRTSPAINLQYCQPDFTTPSRLPQDLQTPPADEPPQRHPMSTAGRPSVRFFMKPDSPNRKSPSELQQQMVFACSIGALGTQQ